jgi:hypothetical protein
VAGSADGYGRAGLARSFGLPGRDFRLLYFVAVGGRLMSVGVEGIRAGRLGAGVSSMAGR